MDVFMLLMLVFSGIGLVDKMTGYKMGLAQEFDKGLYSMGTLALCIVGFYCVGITAARQCAENIARLTSGLPMDPSIIIGCMLSSDAGAQPIAMELSNSPVMGYFSGVIVASCLGQFVSSQLPVLFAAIHEREKSFMVPGFIQGISAVPIGLMVGGILLQLPARSLLSNSGPIITLCVLLAVAFHKASAVTEKTLLAFGGVMRTGGQFLFLVTIVGLFFPRWNIVENNLLHESLVLLLKMVVIICGAMVFAKACLRHFTAQLEWVARKLHTNETSVIGLALSCINSLAIVPLLPDMDKNSLRINAAFAVSGSYILGGQMAVIANLNNGKVFTAYFLSKLAAGIVAVGIAVALNRRAETNICKP